MGAWPEREAPAGEFASAHSTVERGKNLFFPLSFFRLSVVRLTLIYRPAKGAGSPAAWQAGAFSWLANEAKK